ncbi:MAG: hypothetical protein JXR77_10670, partial [Lentisphaeria bacterium]|nr:hypothetical protein [Lentisphaeria bacterium]
MRPVRTRVCGSSRGKGIAGVLAGSLISAWAASAQVLVVTGVTPSGAVNSAVQAIELSFSAPLDGERARDPASYELRDAGLDRVPGTADDRVLPVLPAYTDGGTGVTLAWDAPLACHLGDWRLYDYATPDQGGWSLAGGALTVTGNGNGLPPTFFASPFPVRQNTFRMTLKKSGGDDDFVGWFFSLTVDPDTGSPDKGYVITWKQVAQGEAELGLKLIRMEGSAAYTAGEMHNLMWDGEACGPLAVLDSLLGAGTGYVNDVEYRLDLTLGAGGAIDLTITRASDGTVIWQTSVVDPDPLPPGRAGFYNHEQSGVVYSAAMPDGRLPDRVYQLTVLSGTGGITGVGGDPLDGNGDGTAEEGDHHVAAFTVDRTAPALGRVGNAMAPRFDGSNDRVSVPLVTAAAFADEATTEVWFRTTTTSRHMLFGTLAGLANGLYINRFSTAGDLLFLFDGNSGNDSVGFGTGVADGQWHHAAGVYDHGEVRTYIDGQYVGSKTEVLALSTAAKGYIGADGDGSQVYRGDLAEVRVWNVARTEAQLRADMARRLTGTEPGLVGYWPLDETVGTAALDHSPTGNPGVLGGGDAARVPLRVPAVVPFGAAVDAGVLLFDGSNDFVSIPDDDALDVTTAFTLEAWIFPTAIAGSDRGILSKVGGAGGNNGYQFLATTGAGGDSLTVQFNGAGQGWPSHWLTVGGLDLAGHWTHVAATYDHQDLVLYRDGIEAGRKTIGPVTVANSASSLRISGDDNNHVHFAGRISDVRVWNVARDPWQIARAMALRLVGNEPGLAGYWPLDEGEGATAADRTANGNTGTLGGGNADASPAWEDIRVPPRITRLFAETADTGGMDMEQWTQPGVFTLTGSGGDATFGDGNEVDITAQIEAASVDSATGLVSFDFAAAAPQDVYRLEAAATVVDAAGNALGYGEGYRSAPLALQGEVSTVAMRLAAASDSGAHDDDAITAVTRPEFLVDVNRAGTLAVDFEGDGTADETRDVPAAGLYAFLPAADLPDGPYTATVIFTPAVGSAVGAELGFVIDTSAPAVNPVTTGLPPRFDGSNDTIPTPALQAAFADETVTFSLWFRAEGAGVLVAETANPWANSGGWHTSLMEILSTGEVKVRVWELAAISVGTVAFGEWHHVAVVYDKAALTQRGYLDGVEAATVVNGDRKAPWESGYSAHYLLGAKDGTHMGSGAWFRGCIQRFAVWSTARTAAEIAAEFANGLDGAEAGLVLYYPLDEGAGMVALDAAGGDHNATFGNGNADAAPLWGDGPAGAATVSVGTALRFDGSNDFVDMGDVLDWGASDSWTVETWFFKASAATAGQKILNKGMTTSGTPAGTGYQLRLINRTLEFTVTGVGTPSVASVAPEPSPFAWHHVAGVLDRGAGELRLYIDGELVATTPFTDLGSLDTNIPLAIGALHRGAYGSTVEFFSGALSEVRLWQTVRTAAEIRDTRFLRLEGGEDGLAGYWPLNDGAGMTARDAAAGTFPGTLGAGAAAAAPAWSALCAPLAARTLRVSFVEAGGMDPGTIAGLANYRLLAGGGNATFGDGDDVDLSAHITSVAWDAATQTATLHLDQALPTDWLQLTLDGTAGLFDLAGAAFLGGNDWVSGPIEPLAPTPVVLVDLRADSDTGVSDSDNLTSDTQPVLDVSVDRAGHLEVDSDGDGAPDVTADVAGPGSTEVVPGAPLADGSHTVTAWFYPAYGPPVSSTLAVVVDTQGPTAVPESPAAVVPVYHRRVLFSELVDPGSLVPDQGALTPPGAAGPEAVQGMSAAVGLERLWQWSENGHWYFAVAVPGGVRWDEAQALSTALGGHLVTLASSAENVFVLALINLHADLRDGDTGPWIGLRQSPGSAEPGGNWRWVTEEPPAYTAWSSGNPDNTAPGEEVACYWGTAGQWNDAPLTYTAPGFIVEFDAAPNPCTAADVAFTPQGTEGDYLLSIGPGIRDLAGNPMNADGDGTAGEEGEDAYPADFSVSPLLHAGFWICRVEPMGGSDAPFDRIEIVFSQAVAPGSFTVEDVVLTDDGGAALSPGTVAPVNDVAFLVDFAGATGKALYVLTVGPSIEAAGGGLLDQDHDGTGGESSDVCRARLCAADSQIPSGNTAYDGMHIVVSNATLTVDGTHLFPNLDLRHGSTLTHSATVPGTEYRLELRVEGAFSVDTTSAVDVSTRGYSRNYTVGNTTSGGTTGRSGASHGGYGHPDNGVTNDVYGDWRDPQYPGAGAPEFSSLGGKGGGVIRIETTLALLDGALRANGGDGADNGWGHASGGGAGGSIRLDVGALAGAGILEANGGNYGSGGGGGGRIAVYYDDIRAFDPGNIRAWGGLAGWAAGSPGTVYLKDRAGEGVLRIDSGGWTVGEWTPLGLAADTSLQADRLVVSGSGLIVAPHHGLPVQANHVDVLEGANLTHPETTTGTVYRLELTIADTLTVDAASFINTDSRGYTRNRTVGNTASGAATGRSGASHGGYGHPDSGATNEVYGDWRDPQFPGAGAAEYASLGGEGGGVVRISAARAEIDGAIRCNGGDGADNGWGHASGGGAGGSIRLDLGTLAGTGVIEANGGSYGAGGAGGGRVAILYDDMSGFDAANVHAWGGLAGWAAGSPGTVYLQDRAGEGVLRVDTGGRGVAEWTPLGTPDDFRLDCDRLAVTGTGLIAAPHHNLPIAASNVDVLAGANLTHPETSPSREYRLELSIADTLTVDADSTISTDSRGYTRGYTVGNTATGGATGRSGASHGGYGHPDSGATNEVYGNWMDPRFPGAGAPEYAGLGGEGGGVVRIAAAHAAIAGVIRCNGGDGADNGWGHASGGGAGGSIRLDLGTLAGTGIIEANGGSYGSGGAGGGRVAVYYDDMSAFAPANVHAWGGLPDWGAGAPGTVYLKDRAGEGTLRVDTGGRAVAHVTPLGVSGDALFAADRLVLSGAGLDVCPYASIPVYARNVDILAGALLSHLETTASTVHLLNLSVTGTLTIDADSRIDVTGRGYLEGYTDGNTTSGAATGRSGASHGGLGVASGGVTNAIYGSDADPVLPGAGGCGNTSLSTDGGGVLRLRAGAIALDGAICAGGVSGVDAGWGHGDGGGAGGSIRLDVGTLTGTGWVTADGGNGQGGAGAGGGGRIALYWTDLMDLPEGRITAAGGTGGPANAAAGSLLMQNAPAETVAPFVVASSPRGTVLGLVSEMELTFSEPLAAATFAPADVAIVRPDGTTVPTVEVTVTPLSASVYRIAFPGWEADGAYTVAVGP